jgi:hypothetical protein
MMGGGIEAAGVVGLAACPLPTRAEFAAMMSESRHKLKNLNAWKRVHLILRTDLSL